MFLAFFYALEMEIYTYVIKVCERAMKGMLEDPVPCSDSKQNVLCPCILIPFPASYTHPKYPNQCTSILHHPIDTSRFRILPVKPSPYSGPYNQPQYIAQEPSPIPCSSILAPTQAPALNLGPQNFIPGPACYHLYLVKLETYGSVGMKVTHQNLLYIVIYV